MTRREYALKQILFFTTEAYKTRCLEQSVKPKEDEVREMLAGGRERERVTTWASFYSLAGSGEPYYTDDPPLSANIQKAASKTVGGVSQ